MGPGLEGRAEPGARGPEQRRCTIQTQKPEGEAEEKAGSGIKFVTSLTL